MSFDFDAAVVAPFRMQPGLRRIAPGTPQLTPSVAPNRGVARHLREKLAVIWAYPDEALCAAPGFDPGPAWSALAAHAAAEHPQAWDGDARSCHARWLGWSLGPDGAPRGEGSGWPEIGPFLASLDPRWRAAALLSLAFAEDFAIADAAAATIPWLAVALPSSWAPRDKVGLPFVDVHAPVPDKRLIVDAADRLLRLVCGEQRWERFVWTVTPHPRLHALPRHLDPAGWRHALAADALPALAWWRTERQTFIPVPGALQAVFTIRVEVQPLAQAIATAQHAARLHAAIASMSDAVIAYRGLGPVREPLLRWLALRAAA